MINYIWVVTIKITAMYYFISLLRHPASTPLFWVFSIPFFWVLPLLAWAQTTYFVNPSGNNANNGLKPDAAKQTIADAVSAASAGDIVVLSQGSFASGFTLSKRLTIAGAGKGQSIIHGAVTLSAAVSGTDEMVLKQLTIDGQSSRSDGLTIASSYVRLEHISIINHTNSGVTINDAGSLNALSNIVMERCDINSNGTYGWYIGSYQDVSDVTVRNCSFNDHTQGLYAKAQNVSGNSGGNFRNAAFKNCSFSNCVRKGVYLEKASNCTFDNISIHNSGTSNNNTGSNPGNTGFDLNLKYRSDYTDIRLRNSSITECGDVGNALNGSFTLAQQQQELARNQAIKISCQDASAPRASLGVFEMRNCIVEGSYFDMIIASNNATNPNSTGVDLSKMTIEGNYFLHGDAPSSNNDAGLVIAADGTLDLEHNYWNQSGGPATGSITTSSSRTGDDGLVEDNRVSANYNLVGSNWLNNPIFRRTSGGNYNSHNTLDAAIQNASNADSIMGIPPGNITVTNNLNSPVTLVSPGAGHLEPNHLTTISALTLSSSTALTLGSDIKIDDLTSNSSQVFPSGFVVEFETTDNATIDGTTPCGLIFSGSGTIGNLDINPDLDYFVINTSNGYTAPSGGLIINVTGLLNLEDGALNITNGASLRLGGSFTRNNGTIASNNTSSMEIYGEGTIAGLSLTSVASLDELDQLNVNRHGVLILGTDITLTNALAFTEGYVSTSTNLINLSGATITEQADAYVYDGRIAVTENITLGNTANFGGIGIEITPNSSDMNSTDVNRYTGASLTGNGNNSIERYFTIEPTTNAGLNADVVFTYNEDEIGSINETDLTLYKRPIGGSSTSWTQLTTSSRNTTTNTLTVNGINSFSEITAGDGANAPLPVELVSWEAARHGSHVKLSWETASERNNHFFEVERSEDGNHFTVIGRREGRGTTSIPQQYEMIDAQPIQNHRSYYRLRQVDFDGTEAYSGILVVKGETNIDTDIKPALTAYQLDADRIMVDHPRSQPSQLRLLDMQGRRIPVQQNTVGNQTRLHTPRMATGWYVVEMVHTEGLIERQKLFIRRE